VALGGGVVILSRMDSKECSPAVTKVRCVVHTQSTHGH